VAAHERTARGRRSIGGEQVKQENQAAAGALFVTETVLSLSHFLSILQNNFMNGLNQSSYLIRDLQLWLKNQHQMINRF